MCLFKRIISLMFLILQINFFIQCSNETLISFQEKGILVDIHRFFEIAGKEMNNFKITQDTVSTYALVTPTNIYSFLETSNNATKLRGITPGTTVILTGKLLSSG